MNELSDALSDIWRDDQRSRLLFLIKYSIKEDEKSENDPDVQKLIEQLASIPRGYFDKRLSKEEITSRIRNDFEWK